MNYEVEPEKRTEKVKFKIQNLNGDKQQRRGEDLHRNVLKLLVALYWKT